MNVEDFASVVQLGVGLHAGTAILQIYGEIGLQPMVRAIDRIKSLAEDPQSPLPSDYADRVRKLSNDYDIFKIKMSKEYRRYLVINAVIATGLAIALVAMAYTAEMPMPVVASVLLIAGAILPAPATLFALWSDAEHELRNLRAEAAAIEKAILG